MKEQSSQSVRFPTTKRPEQRADGCPVSCRICLDEVSENIAKFLEAAITGKALAEKAAALATEHGYDFTAAELLELGKARPLSDDEMASAAGGWLPGFLEDLF